jgi:hypothetical protein
MPKPENSLCCIQIKKELTDFCHYGGKEEGWNIKFFGPLSIHRKGDIFDLNP